MEMTCVGLKDDMAMIESDFFLYAYDTFLFGSEVNQTSQLAQTFLCKRKVRGGPAG